MQVLRGSKEPFKPNCGIDKLQAKDYYIKLVIEAFHDIARMLAK